MMQRMNDLPAGVDGVRVSGHLTREDYEHVMEPLLEEIAGGLGRSHLVVQLGSDFERVEPGAAWKELRLSPRYATRIGRCAVVTDEDWLRRLTSVLAVAWPNPLRWFSNEELREAVAWAAPDDDEAPPHRLLEEEAVLVIEPPARLAPEDFDAVAASVDPWLEAGHELKGIVIRADSLPEWEGLAAFVRHVRFVKEHHRRVRRVALVAGGALAPVLPVLAERFVVAELEHFGPGELARALDWVKAA